MASEVLCTVLPFAIYVVGWLCQDARAIRPGSLAVSSRIGNPDHHVLGYGLVTRRAMEATWLGHDDGAIADPQLGPMVVTDPQPLDEPEGRAQPGNRFAYVGIDQHRDDRGVRDGAVLLHAARLAIWLLVGQGVAAGASTETIDMATIDRLRRYFLHDTS
jgi:hypothetical protein